MSKGLDLYLALEKFVADDDERIADIAAVAMDRIWWWLLTDEEQAFLDNRTRVAEVK